MPMTATPESQFRALRTIHQILLGAAVAYVLIAERTAKSSHPVDPVFLASFFVSAGLVAIIAYGFRARMLRAAIESLQQNPQDAQALFRWRQAHIVVMVMLVSITLFGFALRFVGATLLVVSPFYFVSILLLVVWRPKELPLSAPVSSNSAEIRPE